jgi:hypothetical protein
MKDEGQKNKEKVQDQQEKPSGYESIDEINFDDFDDISISSSSCSSKIFSEVRSY